MFPLMNRLNNPQVAQMLDGLLCDLPQLVQLVRSSAAEVSSIRQTLSYEFGESNPTVRGVDLDGPEFIKSVKTTETNLANVDSGEKEIFDFTSVLGKPATRGEITNLGSSMAVIYFLRNKAQAEKPSQLGPYYLSPNSTRAITRFTDSIVILSEDGSEVWVQADVQ
jgi:hypothetical protein